MSRKLTRGEEIAHERACEILEKEQLSEDEKIFVLENWQEGFSNYQAVNGAFFTSLGLARDLCIEVSGAKRIIDLCAGIGTLAFAYKQYMCPGEELQITCLEFNQDYLQVGRKILPEAEWILGDVTNQELIKSLGVYDCAISNPPFGPKIGAQMGKEWLKSTGGFDFKVAEVASYIAKRAVFIMPQTSTPFVFSGRQNFSRAWSEAYEKFHRTTGIEFEFNCGFDTSFYRKEWHGASPTVEIVNMDFMEIHATRAREVQQNVETPVWAVA